MEKQEEEETEGRYWKSRYWYIPIALVIASGYGLGGYYWIEYGFPIDGKISKNVELEYFISLFSLGVIGGSIYCSAFYAKDVKKKIYGNKRLPNFTGPLGYMLTIIGGGFTGILLYLAFKAGLVVLLADPNAELSKYAAWLIALSGGIGTPYVKQFVERFVANATNQDRKKEEEATVFSQNFESSKPDDKASDT